jgi:uncharacterized phiE125 gp8 family phage protein
MLSTKVIAPPQALPVSIVEMRRQLRFADDDTSEDAHITSLLRAAVDKAQTRTNLQLMQATFRTFAAEWTDLELDRNGWFRIFPAPLVSVASVQYYSNNVLTTLAASNYQVDANHQPGLIKFTGSLPGADARPDAIQINFTSGYGAASADEPTQQAAIPADIKDWLKVEVTTRFETRQSVIIGTISSELTRWHDSYLFPYTFVQ